MEQVQHELVRRGMLELDEKIVEEWKKEKRKFLKLHILADKKTGKIAGFRVTSEHTGDSKKFVPLVKEASKKNKITKVYGDSAYDASRIPLQ